MTIASNSLPGGTWVQVWGQVVEKKHHPEDVVVEFFSHNEQYHCDVRRDRVVVGDTPDFAERCVHLKEVDGMYARCTSHKGHSYKHQAGELSWASINSNGFFEEF